MWIRSPPRLVRMLITLNHVVASYLRIDMAERRDSGSDEEPTIAEDVVVTKYKMAGDMANRE